MVHLNNQDIFKILIIIKIHLKNEIIICLNLTIYYFIYTLK